MTRAQVQFSEWQHDALRRISNETGKSIAELVRISIDSMLRTHKMPDPEQQRQDALSVIGQFASGASDVSESHDSHLARAFSQAAGA